MEVIEFKDFKELEYGENNHQKAVISTLDNSVDYEILSREKELSYIDFLNLSSALKIIAEFFDVSSCVIVKDSNICCAALASTSDQALAKCIDSDPISIEKSTIGFSKSVNLEAAKLIKALKITNVIAPDFEKEAFKYLLDTQIKLIKTNTPLHEIQGFNQQDIKITPFGALIEEQNLSKLSKENFNVVSQIKPSQQQAEDAIFGWKVAKHLKTPCAIVAKDLTTKSLIQGCSNPVICAENAMDSACEYSKDAVLVVDGEIENTEIFHTAIQGRIGLIIESGDGKNAGENVKLADNYNLSLIFTNIRNKKYGN